MVRKCSSPNGYWSERRTTPAWSGTREHTCNHKRTYMRTRSIVSATLLVGATCLAVPATVAAQPVRAAAPVPVPTPAAIDSLIAAKMAEADLMGVAGSVFVDGREVWSKGYGHRDYLRTQPFTPTTPMTIASISKTFTGVAMMRLVAEGKRGLRTRKGR